MTKHDQVIGPNNPHLSRSSEYVCLQTFNKPKQRELPPLPEPVHTNAMQSVVALANGDCRAHRNHLQTCTTAVCTGGDTPTTADCIAQHDGASDDDGADDDQVSSELRRKVTSYE